MSHSKRSQKVGIALSVYSAPNDKYKVRNGTYNSGYSVYELAVHALQK